MQELVSIIIPIYNDEKYLEETVSSVCQQTYINLEIILVDDGSNDSSSHICDKLATKDKRIKVIHKSNGGLSSARNVGIDNANGDYLFFLDGDDFIERNTINVLVEPFKSYKNIGIVSAPCFYKYEQGKKSIFRSDWEIDSTRTILSNLFCQLTLEQKVCFSACCKLYKKELFHNLKFREGKKNEDTLFMFDLSFILENKNLNMIEVPNKLYYYRVNIGSITRNVRLPIAIDYIENLKEMMDETDNKKIIKCLKSIYYNELIKFKTKLFFNDEFKHAIDINVLSRFNRQYESISFWDMKDSISIKNQLLYFLINYFPKFYLFMHKIKKSFMTIAS